MQQALRFCSSIWDKKWPFTFFSIEFTINKSFSLSAPLTYATVAPEIGPLSMKKDPKLMAAIITFYKLHYATCKVIDIKAFTIIGSSEYRKKKSQLMIKYFLKNVIGNWSM